MKKTLLTIVGVAALFASCKKNYTCSCTTSKTVTPISNPSYIDPSDENYSYTTDTEYEKVKKRTVRDKFECYSTESTEVETFFVINPNTGPTTENANVKRSYDCEITK